MKGKRVAGFANSGEEAVGLTKVVPFLVEDMLEERGGLSSKVDDGQPQAARRICRSIVRPLRAHVAFLLKTLHTEKAVPIMKAAAVLDGAL